MSHVRDVIRPILAQCVGVFIAERQPCLGLNATVPAKKRTSHKATQASLQPTWFAGSYASCVLLCPDDDTSQLAAFARQHQLDPKRFHFYSVAGVDLQFALAAWRTAGFAVHSIEHVDSWGDVNQHFGNHWNLIAHDDACKTPACQRH